VGFDACGGGAVALLHWPAILLGMLDVGRVLRDGLVADRGGGVAPERGVRLVGMGRAEVEPQ
jgi:hypothetical protein